MTEDKGERCVVINSFIDKGAEERREEGDLIWLQDEEKIERWREKNLIRIVGKQGEIRDWPWGVYRGRELNALPPEPGGWNRVVACLNIWQDLPDLKATIDTWYPYVDHVIAVDGAYKGVPINEPYSTDGTLEYLKKLDKVELVETEQFWSSQTEKRSVYFDKAEEGDLLFIVDADEFVIGAENLKDIPDLDVGWIRYYNPLYTRGQDFPRIFRAQEGLHYEGRHHWIYDDEENLVTTCQRGGVGFQHRLAPIAIDNNRGLKRTRMREIAANRHRQKQANIEKDAGPQIVGGIEPLRIVQLCSIDPGMVVFRLHTAINTTTPHESIMASTRHDRPYKEPYQYDVSEDRETLRHAISTADLVHCHLSYQEFFQLGVRTGAPVIIHHHGTMFRERPEKCAQVDERRADVRLVSNLELMQYDDDLNFLPNPVHVGRYKKYADQVRPSWDERPFRVAHSPSKRELKGTDEFLNACDELQKMGFDIEPVLIENETLEHSIKTKAKCHAVFDSFWLGMQCAGLEAAACGVPVIAGDRTVKGRYVDRLGEVPYVFADTEAGLEAALDRLMTDRAFYNRERKRIYSYVLNNHDYSAVAHRYLKILDTHLNWRTRMRIGAFKGL
jgi:glycosyltransferase involved in cell wall biosynthesis